MVSKIESNRDKIKESSRDKVKRLLRELFQFDAQDLDFGIYRILNFRRKEIERFIEKDLIAAVEVQFKEYAKANIEELQRDVERLKAEINRDFGEGTIDAQGRVVKHEDAPKIQEYLRKVEELKSAEISEAQMNEVFNHVYEFFSRYYDNGDFISKRRYGGRDKYYIPYNGEEVVLHWANKDQYYVKTTEYFRNYHFKTGGYRINFLIREAEVEVNNVAGANKYFVLCDSDFIEIDEEKRIVNIYFEWRTLTDEEKRKFGERNVQDVLVNDAIKRIFSATSGRVVDGLLQAKENENKTVLEKHLNNYVKRNTSDYFIHKNLKTFLERELEFYIKNEVMDLDELENLDERSLRIVRAKVKAIRGISQKIIEFLAQIEDFQKMLFEKKKFIIGTEYVITLDKIKEYAGEEFLESIVDEILKNTKQVEEWKDLLKVEVKSKNDLIEKQTIYGKEFKKLPLDTRYFEIDFKIRLLEALSERNTLDEIIDGILIKSENFQALNLLLPKFYGAVKTIYIDPPFNTGSGDFLYKDTYRHSSWMSMIFDRIVRALDLLGRDGHMFIHIDDNENVRLKLILNDILGPENYRNEIIVKRIKKNISEYELVKSLNTDQDVILFYSKTPEARIIPPTKKREKKPRWHSFEAAGYRTGMDYELFGVRPMPGNHWRWSKERAEKAIQEGRLRPNPKTGKPEYLVVKEEEVIGTNWSDIPAYSFDHNFNTEKSEQLLRRIIEMGSSPKQIVADFFVGCGTTCAVAQKLNRKWIAIDMGDFFETILLSRMKTVLAGERSGISKDVGWQGGGFFKYHYVEQYEDTLNNIIFREKNKTIQETLESFQDYFLRYMLDYETRDSPARLNIEEFQMPFDYKIWVTTAGEKRLVTVDLVETFNYLIGITVERLRTFKDQEREYRCVFGKLGQENTVIIWRNTKDIDLRKDKEFIENTVLAGIKPDRIFINGDSLVEKAEPIEPEFKRLMGA